MSTGDDVCEPGGAWRVLKSQAPDLEAGVVFEMDFCRDGLRVFSDRALVSMTLAYSEVSWENWGGPKALLRISGSDVEVERAGAQLVNEVAELLGKWRQAPVVERLGEPHEQETVLVFSYPGRTQADAAQRFATHAQLLGRKGYRPIAQSWAEGRPGVGRVLMIGDAAGLIRPKGFLTVTYQLNAVIEPQSASPDPIDQIRRLGELRDQGILTAAEFETKKADLLARI